MSQDCQGHEKQGRTEKLSQTKGDWADMTTTCKAEPWTGGGQMTMKKVAKAGGGSLRL